MTVQQISNYLNKSEPKEAYFLTDKLLEQRFSVLDITHKDSTNSMCFTKAYQRYLEGTGSVYSEISKSQLDSTIKTFNILPDPKIILHLKKSLLLRFFSPSEVSKLMCFPEDFGFPENVTDKQKYRLLGNSVNVKVVSELINLMVEL